MGTSDELSFQIISSTFTNNRTTNDGGVMNTVHKSSFMITNSTFSNRAEGCGGGAAVSFM